MNRKKGNLLNYTTQISVEKTVSEIEYILSQHSAKAIVKKYEAGNIVSLAFLIEFDFGEIPFLLPMNAKSIMQIINNQVEEGKIPKKFFNDLSQAHRIGWRILKSWVEAQMAIVETQMVKIQEVFLPYMYSPNKERTFYQELEEKKFKGLLIEQQSKKTQSC